MDTPTIPSTSIIRSIITYQYWEWLPLLVASIRRRSAGQWPTRTMNCCYLSCEYFDLVCTAIKTLLCCFVASSEDEWILPLLVASSLRRSAGQWSLLWVFRSSLWLWLENILQQAQEWAVTTGNYNRQWHWIVVISLSQVSQPTLLPSCQTFSSHVLSCQGVLGENVSYGASESDLWGRQINR
jgi:hypothetical protein